MPETAPAATPLLTCPCRLIRPVLLYSGLAGLILTLIAAVIGVVLTASVFGAGAQPKAGLGLLLLVVSVPLIVGLWRLLWRAQPEYEADLTAEVLRFTPRGRALRRGEAAFTLTLADIVGYARTYQANAQTLRLHLRDGRVLRLSAEPRPVKLADDAPWTGLEQLADALLRQLSARPAGAAGLERPNFFQSALGRALAGLAWVTMAVGVVLMLWPGVEWTLGARLLAFPSFYLGAYAANTRKP